MNGLLVIELNILCGKRDILHFVFQIHAKYYPRNPVILSKKIF